MQYSYKPGAQLKTPAEVAGQVCQELEESGGLTAKRLLDASRPVDAPLHDEFEWDNSEAAEKYREYQAAHIIRRIIVRPEQVEKEPVRAFVNVTDNVRSYRSLDVVLQTTNLREQLLGQALKDLRAFEQKYSTLSELAEVFNAIHQFQDTAT
ncbi:MAG: hypothetical protein LUE24_11830 [Lachnospiraceae bacterium]|nr:hypothetical protein [Lachnospiraceae bacterium]